MVDERARQVLADYAQAVLEKYKEQLIHNGAVASGNLLNTTEDIEIVYGNDANEYRILFNIEPYYQYVETGRLPGSFPSVDAIKQWILTKPVIPYPFRLPTGKTIIPTLDQLAFLIGRKIYRDGILPRPFIQNALEELREKYKEQLEKAIEEDLIEEIINLLTQQ